MLTSVTVRTDFLRLDMCSRNCECVTFFHVKTYFLITSKYVILRSIILEMMISNWCTSHEPLRKAEKKAEKKRLNSVRLRIDHSKYAE